jgi:hypothetical protein
MAIPQALTDALNKLNTETNEISEYVKGLKDKISTSMTAEEVASVTAGLDAVSTRLDGLAANPDNPVPPSPPLPESFRRR